MLTQDMDLMERLPVDLVEVDEGIEVQVVSDLAGLRLHLQTLHPDAMVLDVASLGEEAIPDVLDEDVVARVPTIVLDRSDTEDSVRKATILEAGAADYISRSGPYVGRLEEAVIKTKRMANLGGRLKEAERHFNDILEASHDGIFVLVDGIFRYVNSSFGRALGRSPDALVGERGLLDFVTDSEVLIVGEELSSVEATGAHNLIEMTLRCEGQDRRYEVSCRGSVIDGRRAVVGVARDVNAQSAFREEIHRNRQRAAQVERLRALGELAAGVAHDFNNALGTIIGRLVLAQDKLQRGQPVHEDLAVIESAARNAAATVGRIQDFSRPARSDRWEEVDLATVVRDAADFVRTDVPRGVELVLDVSPTPTILGNSEELREVLLNLLRNAVDAIEERGSIKLSCRSKDELVEILVEDDGHGMPPDVQKRIFEPFFTTKGESGTGLGLSVSHWILRRHDAQIQLTSEEGKGTQFRLMFAPSTATSQFTPIDKQSLSILVVDDDATVAEMVRDLLIDQGHQVTVLQNAEETAHVLQQQPVDVLITDLDLQDMSGWQLAREVRGLRPDISVGLMTGWPLDATEEELRARGVDFSLNKPFGVDALVEALAKVTRSG